MKTGLSYFNQWFDGWQWLNGRYDDDEENDEYDDCDDDDEENKGGVCFQSVAGGNISNDSPGTANPSTLLQTY